MTDSLRVQRATYLVSDLDRALTFYRDILGFALAFVKDSAADSYSYPLFDIDRRAKMRFAVLSTPSQPRSFALTEITGVPLPPPNAPRRAALVLNVPDIDPIIAAAKAAGLTTFAEERLVTQDGRVGREQGLLDFDSNLVLVYTIL